MGDRGKTKRGGMGRLVSASLLAVLLSGCSDLGLFANTKTADDGTYPNLGTVPARPAARSDAGEWQTAREGLAADRANARYSADPIRRPYPEGAAAAVPPDGNFPVQSTFRPTEAPPGSAPVQSPTPLNPASTSVQKIGDVQPSSQGMPVAPPSEPRQAAPEAPPPAPADLVPQAAPVSVAPIPAPAPVSAVPAAPVAQPTPAAPLPLKSGADIDAKLKAMVAASGADPIPTTYIGETAPTSPSLATLYFRDGSAHLDGAALSVLKQVAGIQKSRGQRLVLVGHASRRAETNDPVKRETFNQKISAARAENTRKALQRLGVKALMVSVRASGDQAAAFDEAAPAGEAANRKVEIYLED